MEIDLASINQELAKSMPKPKSLVPSQGEETALENFAEEIDHDSAPIDSTLAKELMDLKEQHAEEIKRWKEYDRRIQEWKQQVQDVFQNMKKEIAAKQELAAELINCKSLLQSKEKELGTLRSFIEQKEGKA